jgi:DNA replication protein DnaC
MTREYENRLIKRRKQRLKRADLPFIKNLEDIDKDALPDQAKEKLPDLATLKFIDQGRNLILAGNPGTGKTHIAISLAIKACQKDYSVFFTSVPKLITQIQEAKSDRTLRALQSRFEKYDLVVCDEFGYISFDKAAAELLFTHLSLRASRKSTIITTNLGFNRWNEIFQDKVLTAAMVDRLIHNAIIVNMTGQSFRLKSHENFS